MENNNNNSGMRLVDLFMLGFGSMIGVGWTVSLNNWFQTSGGVIGTILAFIIGTLMVIPIGLCFAELTGALRVSGGTMAFGLRSKGSKLSFLGGWLNALSYSVLLPWEMIYIGHILGILFPILVSGDPIYSILGYDVYLPQLVCGILITLIFAFFNFRGADISGKLQTFLTSAILIIALILAIFGFLNFNLDNLQPIYYSPINSDHNSFIGGLISMLVIVPFFMAGFDTIPQAVEDADDSIDSHQISKVIVFTIAAAGLFYVIIVLASAGAMPWTEFAKLDSPPLAFLFRKLYAGALGEFLYYLTMVGALAGLLSTYNGMFIATSKLLQSMGKVELIPKVFGNTNDNGVPTVGILFSTFVTLIGPFFGTSVIDPLTNVGSLSFVIGWFITCYSALVLRNIEPNLDKPMKAGENKFIIKLSMIISFGLIVLSMIPNSPGFIGRQSMYILVLWLLLGVIFYIYSDNNRTISLRKRKAIMFDDIDH